MESHDEQYHIEEEKHEHLIQCRHDYIICVFHLAHLLFGTKRL